MANASRHAGHQIKCKAHPARSESCLLELPGELFSLLAMSDFDTFHPLLQDILVLLTTLDRDSKSVTFCWVPSHVGIIGNERADEAAKRASRGQRTRFQPLPASDLLAVCSSHVRLKWQEDWESSGSSKLTRARRASSNMLTGGAIAPAVEQIAPPPPVTKICPPPVKV